MPKAMLMPVGHNCHQKSYLYEWLMWPPEAALRSMVHAAIEAMIQSVVRDVTRDDVHVSRSYHHQKSSGLSVVCAAA